MPSNRKKKGAGGKQPAESQNNREREEADRWLKKSSTIALA